MLRDLPHCAEAVHYPRIGCAVRAATQDVHAADGGALAVCSVLTGMDARIRHDEQSAEDILSARRAVADQSQTVVAAAVSAGMHAGMERRLSRLRS